MTTYISLLRGINVSGQKPIKMDALKSMYDTLGFHHVGTYIQSGNVVFQSGDTQQMALRNRIMEQIHHTFGFEVNVLLRTCEEWETLLKKNPFKSLGDDARLYLAILSDPPDNQRIQDLKALPVNNERFEVIGREVYFVCPKGYGKAKLNNNLLEKKLKVLATTRNWRTVNRLHEMAQAIG